MPFSYSHSTTAECRFETYCKRARKFQNACRNSEKWWTDSMSIRCRFDGVSMSIRCRFDTVSPKITSIRSSVSHGDVQKRFHFLLFSLLFVGLACPAGPGFRFISALSLSLAIDGSSCLQTPSSLPFPALPFVPALKAAPRILLPSSVSK